ncbi:hypothetical protein niasHS_008400 [Heterodera schachtii]|uniref:Uncharacterized protein n=1 Tax=Heterodera schachtii TaxID=97005 RepID=A0ABD2J6N3_HETSC
MSWTHERPEQGPPASPLVASVRDDVKTLVRMVMCLLSYGAGLDEQADSDKMTALHLAVSKRNLQITRLLLCLCADPNVANAHGDTPTAFGRHN